MRCSCVCWGVRIAMQVRVWDVERQKEVAHNKIHCNVVRLSVRVPFSAATINCPFNSNLSLSLSLSLSRSFPLCPPPQSPSFPPLVPSLYSMLSAYQPRCRV